MVKVSVIIPVYNAGGYLAQCLKSVTGQTLKDIEIICVNDGSTDDSADILEEYRRKDDRIQVITQENAGAGAARNTGLDAAGGKYLSFLDADDFFEPDMLKLAFEEAERYTADFVVFHADRYHTDTKETEKTPWMLRDKDIPPYMPFSYRQLTGNIFKTFVGWAWDKLYLRSFVERHDLRFQEQRTTNDMLFVFSALVVAKRIAIVDKVLVHQRRDKSDSLSVTREKSWYCFYDALMALRERLYKEDRYWELEQDFINYALHFSLWNLNSLKGPTYQILKDKLCDEWFAELGIEGKPESYFYDKGEYKRYQELIRRDGKA